MHPDEHHSEYNMFYNYLNLPTNIPGDITLPSKPQSQRPLMGRQQPEQDAPDNLFNAKRDKSSLNGSSSPSFVPALDSDAHSYGRAWSTSDGSDDTDSSDYWSNLNASSMEWQGNVAELPSSNVWPDRFTSRGFENGMGTRNSGQETDNYGMGTMELGNSSKGQFRKTFQTGLATNRKGFFNKAVGGPIMGSGQDNTDDDKFTVSSCSSGESEDKFSNGNHMCTSSESFEIDHWSDFVRNNNIGEPVRKSSTSDSTSSNVEELGMFEIGHWSNSINPGTAVRNAELPRPVSMDTNGFRLGINSMNDFQQFGRGNHWNQRRTREEGMFCAFCRRNGETVEYYTTHVLKDGRGRVICPILRKYVCPECKATGDGAHTIRHCPVRKMKGLV